VGTLLGGLAATILGLRGGASLGEALLIGLPMGFAQAALCMAARYPARAVPLGAGRMFRVGATHLSAGAVSTAAWMGIGFLLARLLESFPAHAGSAGRFQREAAPLALAAVLIYLLAVTAHYLVIALEAAREAEMRSVQSKVLAREAELRALRSQVDPHFLFNALNSIATLTGEDSAAARRMCLQLATLLRRSLALGRRDRILLREELALVSDYLGIESIRFGDRLRIVEAIEEACLDCPVPPFLLQPVVENAVRHGIARIPEGGTLRLAARRDGEGVFFEVDNPRDPENPGGGGAGVGLENVRGRLRNLHGGRARLDLTETPEAFQVRLFIPWQGTADRAGEPAPESPAPDSEAGSAPSSPSPGHPQDPSHEELETASAFRAARGGSPPDSEPGVRDRSSPVVAPGEDESPGTARPAASPLTPPAEKERDHGHK
jgi:histidine kinase